ncbi:MAG: hypothetical protein HBSAPP02_06950 [Phycisphaerae bacterium]|nr:MAG: glycosyltransferase family 39 protein [Planctomycetia bacterium]RIK68741.1 MAG: hypothetical protein DCC66_09580 [Planctomycetota bacterium]GJQ25663.1 MAG: hypothetical protein HBSAPP02_06950 [Phycisphaerae bacterium]
MTPHLTASTWRHVAAIVLLAALVRVHAASRLECISRDGVHFVEFAKQLAADPVAAMKGTSKQPGYSYLLLGAMRMLGGDSTSKDPQTWLRAGQMVAVLGGVASCVLVYFLTRRLFDPLLAGIAGLFAALWPQGAELSGDVLSDMPHLALYLAALLGGLRALEHSDCMRRMTGWAAACGAMVGAAYWLRQEALGAVIAVGAGLALGSKRGRRGRAAIAALSIFVTFGAVASPPSLITGSVMPNKNLRDLLLGEPAGSLSVNSPFGAFVLAEWLPWYKAPGRMADAWGASGKYILSTLVVIGLFLRSAPRARTTGARLVGMAIGLQLVAVLLRVKTYGEISSRYMVIPAALTIPWAAAGFTTLVSLVAARWPPHRAPAVIAAALLVVLAPLAWFCTRPIHADKACLREAGQWLEQNAGRDAVVMAHDRLEQLMFYAGRFKGDPRWIVAGSAGAPDAPVKPAALLNELRATLADRRSQWHVEVTRTRRWSDAEDEAFFLELRGGAMPLRVVKRFSTGKHDVFVFEANR